MRALGNCLDLSTGRMSAGAAPFIRLPEAGLWVARVTTFTASFTPNTADRFAKVWLAYQRGRPGDLVGVAPGAR